MLKWAKEILAEGHAGPIGAAGRFADPLKAAALEKAVNDAVAGYSAKQGLQALSMVSRVGFIRDGDPSREKQVNTER